MTSHPGGWSAASTGRNVPTHVAERYSLFSPIKSHGPTVLCLQLNKPAYISPFRIAGRLAHINMQQQLAQNMYTKASVSVTSDAGPENVMQPACTSSPLRHEIAGRSWQSSGAECCAKRPPSASASRSSSSTYLACMTVKRYG